MKRILQLLIESGVIFAVLLPLSARCGDTNVNGKTDRDLMTNTCQEFFTSDRQDLPKDFRQALNRSGFELALTTSEYPHVVANFTWFMRTTLKGEYIPSDAFIMENLQLLPAGEKGTKDRAVLSYRKGANDYLIVQTGGFDGRLYIFIRGNAASVKTRDQDAQRLMLEIVSQYIQVPSGAESPKIRMHEQGKLHFGTVGPLPVNRDLLQTLEGGFSDGEVALSVRRRVLGTTRASDPQPNHWFEWEKKAWKEEIEVEKVLSKYHSPENLAKERKALESGGLWSTNATRSPLTTGEHAP